MYSAMTQLRPISPTRLLPGSLVPSVGARTRQFALFYVSHVFCEYNPPLSLYNETSGSEVGENDVHVYPARYSVDHTSSANGKPRMTRKLAGLAFASNRKVGSFTEKGRARRCSAPFRVTCVAFLTA